MSYTSLLFHCVFATKERRALISDDLQTRLWAYMGGIAGRQCPWPRQSNWLKPDRPYGCMKPQVARFFNGKRSTALSRLVYRRKI